MPAIVLLFLFIVSSVFADGPYTRSVGRPVGSINASSIAAPGSNGQVIYNSSGSFGADSGFTYNASTDTVTANGNLLATSPTGTVSASFGNFTTISITSAGIRGNVSLTTGFIHLGSPTTVPTCDATNKGNLFINTTTNCLNYCDGTANRQVTSLAASCT